MHQSVPVDRCLGHRYPFRRMPNLDVDHDHYWWCSVVYRMVLWPNNIDPWYRIASLPEVIRCEYNWLPDIPQTDRNSCHVPTTNQMECDPNYRQLYKYILLFCRNLHFTLDKHLHWMASSRFSTNPFHILAISLSHCVELTSIVVDPFRLKNSTERSWRRNELNPAASIPGQEIPLNSKTQQSTAEETFEPNNILLKTNYLWRRPIIRKWWWLHYLIDR